MKIFKILGKYGKDLSSGPICSKLKKVVSWCDVKISILKYGEYVDIFFFFFFAEEMWVAFVLKNWKKLLTFLQQTYQWIWKYLSYNS